MFGESHLGADASLTELYQTGHKYRLRPMTPRYGCNMTFLHFPRQQILSLSAAATGGVAMSRVIGAEKGRSYFYLPTYYHNGVHYVTSSALFTLIALLLQTIDSENKTRFEKLMCQVAVSRGRVVPRRSAPPVRFVFCIAFNSVHLQSFAHTLMVASKRRVLHGLECTYNTNWTSSWRKSNIEMQQAKSAALQRQQSGVNVPRYATVKDQINVYWR